MLIRKKINVGLWLLLIVVQTNAQSKSPNVRENHILGDWMSLQKNLIVNVSKDGNGYKAKIVWFSDRDDPSKPMDTRLDHHNPNKQLRSRKLIGLDLLTGLRYNPRSGRWEDGVIYDPLSGKDWSSLVTVDQQGQLVVKGYWQFEFLCKSITFKRLKANK